MLIKTDALSLSHYETFCFTALHGMPAWTSDKNGVCLYVRVSVKRVHCDKMEEKSVQIFNHAKDHLAWFSEKENGWWVATHST